MLSKMCGIAGFYGFEDKVLLKRMADICIHRGPDDDGYYSNKNIMLANRRLSIIDLSSGKQPIFNEDKSIAIVYNGEIYNFKELRIELEKKGHRFYTNTDTEAIVHSYEEYGVDCLKLFNGMFAFALYDNNKKQLLLARDRCGIKPLYYAMLDNGALLFASEIKSILQYEKVKREVDLDALNYFIRLRYVPKEKTMLEGIKKLLPGHYLTISKKGVNIEGYWKLHVKINDSINEDYAVKKLKELTKRSVQLQMISDVPIGSFLSGGLDTSTIVAFASQTAEQPINTFCMGFDEATDEFEYARIVAEKFKTNHKELVVKMDLLKEFPKMIWHIDFPKRNLYPFFIYREVAKHVKVVHSGLGGDELLAGYVHRYKYMDDFLKMKGNDGIKINRTFNPIFSDKEHDDKIAQIKKSKNPAEAYSTITTADAGFDEKQLKEIYSERLKNKIGRPVFDVFEEYFENSIQNKNLGIVERTFAAEFNVKMPDDFLIVEDSMSMANSVESRVPFLDNNLIDFCFSLPSKLKMKDNVGKYLLRKMMKNTLPKKIIDREKWGFATTTYNLYKKELQDIAKNILPSGILIDKKYINKEFVDKALKQKINESDARNYNLLWNLVAFEIWHKIYIEPIDFRKPNFSINYFLG